jgi:hypothetical protein
MTEFSEVRRMLSPLEVSPVAGDQAILHVVLEPIRLPKVLTAGSLVAHPDLPQDTPRGRAAGGRRRPGSAEATRYRLIPVLAGQSARREDSVSCGGSALGGSLVYELKIWGCRQSKRGETKRPAPNPVATDR